MTLYIFPVGGSILLSYVDGVIPDMMSWEKMERSKNDDLENLISKNQPKNGETRKKSQITDRWLGKVR